MDSVEMLTELSRVSPKDFNGTLEDLFMLNELWSMRIGTDDSWLLRIYNANFQKHSSSMK